MAQINSGMPLSTFIDGTYSGTGYNYSIANNIVSVYTAGAIENNMVSMPFLPVVPVVSGDIVSVSFSLEPDSTAWKARTCNIFIGDRSRINLCDKSITSLDGLTLTATSTTAINLNKLCIRFRNQGVSYSPPLKFTAEIKVNGVRVL